MILILKDLNRVADAHPKNAYMLSPVVRRIAALYARASKAEIEAELRQHCTVTPSESGDVLQGWCLRRGTSQAV